MRKIAIIMSVLIISLNISSCQTSQNQITPYTVLINEESLSLINIDAEKYDTFSMSKRQYNNNDASSKKMEKILEKNYALSYLHSTISSIDGENLDYYYNESLDCQVAYSTKTGKLLRIVSQKTDGKIIPVNETLLNIEGYFLWLKEIIANTLEVDTSDYTLNCQTYYTDGTSENTFILSSTDLKKQIDFYYLEYVRYIGKYESTEIVKIIAQPDGSLKSLIHSVFPLKTDIDIITIEEDKLNQTIEKTVYNICPSKYSIKDYTIKNIVWQIYEGTPYLMCGVEIISTDTKGEEIGCSVIFAITS